MGEKGGDVFNWRCTNAAHDTEYSGEVTAPDNVIIYIESDSVHISWNLVENATSYKVYSSDNPYAAEPWNFEVEVIETNWSEAVGTNEKKFYYVTAVN